MSDPAARKPDRRVLLLAPDDNVCVACVGLRAGERVEIDGRTVTLDGDVDLGHKIARRPLAAGETVVKWGAPIGSMTAAAPAGAHVHLHNMKSDYIPTYTFEAGHRFTGEGAR